MAERLVRGTRGTSRTLQCVLQCTCVSERAAGANTGPRDQPKGLHVQLHAGSRCTCLRQQLLLSCSVGRDWLPPRDPPGPRDQGYMHVASPTVCTSAVFLHQWLVQANGQRCMQSELV